MRVMFAIALGIVGACSGSGGTVAHPAAVVASSVPDAASAPPDAAADGEQSIAAAIAILCESNWDGKAEEYATRTWIPDDLASQITNDDVTKLIEALAAADHKAPMLRDYLADNGMMGLDCPLEYRLESSDEMTNPEP